MLAALSDMMAAGEEINMYVPTPSDIEWATNFLRMIRDGGIWEVPRLGIYVVSHKEKTLTLVEQWGDDEYFDLDVAVFKMCGYRVVKKLAKQVPTELLN